LKYYLNLTTSATRAASKAMQAADKHKLDEVTTAKISEFASC